MFNPLEFLEGNFQGQEIRLTSDNCKTHGTISYQAGGTSSCTSLSSSSSSFARSGRQYRRSATKITTMTGLQHKVRRPSLNRTEDPLSNTSEHSLSSSYRQRRRRRRGESSSRPHSSATPPLDLYVSSGDESISNRWDSSCKDTASSSCSSPCISYKVHHFPLHPFVVAANNSGSSLSCDSSTDSNNSSGHGNNGGVGVRRWDNSSCGSNSRSSSLLSGPSFEKRTDPRFASIKLKFDRPPIPRSRSSDDLPLKDVVVVRKVNRTQSAE